jgi:hypothetical protein
VIVATRSIVKTTVSNLRVGDRVLYKDSKDGRDYSYEVLERFPKIHAPRTPGSFWVSVLWKDGGRGNRFWDSDETDKVLEVSRA